MGKGYYNSQEKETTKEPSSGERSIHLCLPLIASSPVSLLRTSHTHSLRPLDPLTHRPTDALTFTYIKVAIFLHLVTPRFSHLVLRYKEVLTRSRTKSTLRPQVLVRFLNFH